MLAKKRSDILENKEMETKILNAKTVLEKNIRSVKNELVKLSEASVKLSKETGEIRERITKNSKDLKERIDKYVDKMTESVEATYQQNITGIQTHRKHLEDKVKCLDNDVEKCKSALTKTSANSSESLVSERKVLQMILDSVNTALVTPDLKLIRTKFLEKDSAFKDEKMEELVGNVDKKEESLEDIRHDLFQIKSFPCPQFEVNAMACDRDDRSVWTCMGTHLELVNLTDNGDVNNVIDLDVKTDDITLGPDSGIYTTTPDGHSVLKFDPKQTSEQISKEIYKNDVYIHGINTSMEGERIVLCATDKPNYSDIRPNETFIMELRPDGSLIRKIKLKQFRGKVYRIAENINKEFVLTFPKEGCVLSVDSSGNIKNAFSKQTGTPNKTIDRGRVLSLKEFWPTGVCCNSKGRIFVTDWLGKRVVVLDSVCKYVRDIGTEYINPNAICVNLNLDTIWIGDKGRIYVWQT